MIEEQQRAESGEGQMIVAMAPLDCLSFYSSKSETLRGSLCASRIRVVGQLSEM